MKRRAPNQGTTTATRPARGEPASEATFELRATKLEITGGPAHLGADFDRWISQIYLPRTID